MINTIDHYISELLFLHDCVILPEFGGFVSNPQSAKLNKITGILSPPSKQILFNTNLKTNDGLLISHVSSKEGISQDLAKKEVMDFINQISNKLHGSKVLRIKKVGLFTVGKENNIIFIQDIANNYSLDSFGMNSMHKKPISRVIETEKRISSSIKNIQVRNRTSKEILKAAAVMIPLALLSYVSISEKDRINNLYSQMATFNPFIKTEIATTIKAKPIIEKEIIETIKAEPIIEKDEKQDVIVNPYKKTYYIIGGAFSKSKNATKMQARLKNLNYNSEIIDGGRLLKVSYDSFNNKQDAIWALSEIKKVNPSAWLLTK